MGFNNYTLLLPIAGNIQYLTVNLTETPNQMTTLHQVKLALLNKLALAQDPALVKKMRATVTKALNTPPQKGNI